MDLAHCPVQATICNVSKVGTMFPRSVLFLVEDKETGRYVSWKQQAIVLETDFESKFHVLLIRPSRDQEAINNYIQ